MSGGNFIVPARGWAELDQIGVNLREQLARIGLDEPYLPIIDVMEKVMCNHSELFHFRVGTHAEMDGAEGLCCPSGELVMLREDVYEGACAGQGRDRFTAAHELAHRILHTGTVALQRAKPGGTVQTYRLSEPQADQLAAAILMPAKYFTKLDDEDSVAKRHGVSRPAAASRLRYLVKKGII